MCNHWKLKKSNELTLEQWKNIIEQLPNLNVKEVDISGGEPFFRKDIFDIISYLTKKKIRINITTNFTLLTKKNIERLFDSSITRLQISLDGINEVHDSIRGVKGTFKKVMDNVEYFKKIRKQTRNNIQLNATTVIMNKNLHQLVELYEFTKKLGFTSITYQPVVDDNLNIVKRTTSNPLKISQTRIEEMDTIINKLIKLRKKDHYISNSIKHFEDIKNYFKDKPLKDVKCYSGFIVGIISPNGMFWSCMGEFADLKKQTLKKAWFSKKASKKRHLIKNCKSPCLYPCYLESNANSLLNATKNVLKNK